MKKFKSSVFFFAFAGFALLSTNAQAVLVQGIEFVNSTECFSKIQLLFQNEAMELDEGSSQKQTRTSDAKHFKKITGKQEICDDDGGYTLLLLFRAIQSHAQNALTKLSNENSLQAAGWKPWGFERPLDMPGEPPLKPRENPLKKDGMQKPKDEWEAKKQYREDVAHKWLAKTEHDWECQKWAAGKSDQKHYMQCWAISMQSWTTEMKNRESQPQKWESKMKEWETVLNNTEMKEWNLIKNSLLASLSVFSTKVQQYGGLGRELSEELRTILTELQSLKEGDLPQYSIFSRLGTIIQDKLRAFIESPKVPLAYKASPRYPELTPLTQYGITDLYFTIPAYGSPDTHAFYEGDFENLFKSFEKECEKFRSLNAKNSD